MHLRNFDWKVKLAVSSSELSNMGVPLLELALTVDAPETKDGVKRLTFELNKDELVGFLDKLEALQTAME
ncbi:HCaRG [Carpediemonas membranifera]|uniref:HCaRG n=1 Tax=Carpediemonas membranifera TaxID=201153 RepID=A0A8J6ATJ3_9EUKA|nr:HCaRG [Carpediemonas membranifera]|eukprot:KAG9394231.1 HCaRG [Carpediemonas membranifera]